MNGPRFITLHVNDPTFGVGEVLVNLNNVLFILPKHRGSPGSSLSFRCIEGEQPEDLFVTEDLAQIKVLL